jgi:hypothetical protein
MSEQVASHSEDVPDEQKGLSDEQYAEIMSHLGYEAKNPQKAAEETTNEEEDEDDNTEASATEQTKSVRKVKFNKKEVEIEEGQIDEYLQKGLALDKERERKSELEKALQRAAKLAGFDSHEDYLQSLDKLEEQAKQREKDQFEDLKKQIREDAESAGLDPEKVEQFIENHPLMKQAQEAIAERDKREQESKAAQERSTLEKQWEELFTKYPDLANSDDAEWLTPDMDAKLKRGYHPLDAYELVHRDKILAEERSKGRQAAIKDSRLNKRAAVEKNVSPETDDGVPDVVKGAFKMFGLDPKKAKKFM